MVWWSLRGMTVEDLPAVVDMQERGAVRGLAVVFPQETYPFPRDAVLDRWRDELEAPDVAAYVAVDELGALTGFAARRDDELLHFGTAVQTWGTGHAAWLHDALIATYPPPLRWLRLRVFEDNHRARRFYERLGWTATGRESRSSFVPHPVLVEYVLDRCPGG